MVPGLARFDVFRTVFAYLSSVQLYQDHERNHGGALTDYDLAKEVTGLADNTFTDVLTVTVPNAAHSAAIALVLNGRLGADCVWVLTTGWNRVPALMNAATRPRSAMPITM